MVGGDADPRYSLANERTFLAWIRTSLGMLAVSAGLGRHWPAMARLRGTRTRSAACSGVSRDRLGSLEEGGSCDLGRAARTAAPRPRGPCRRCRRRVGM